MSDAEQELIREIQQHTASDELRLVYADWLEERGDRRAEYLRLEFELAKSDVVKSYLDSSDPEGALLAHDAMFVPLFQMLEPIDPDWIRKIGIRFDLVIVSFGNKKLNAVKCIKYATEYSLMACKEIAESAPEVVLHSCPFVDIATEEAFNYRYKDWLEDPIFVVQKTGLLRMGSVAKKFAALLEETNVDMKQVTSVRELKAAYDVVDLYLVDSGSTYVITRLVQFLTQLSWSEATILTNRCPSRLLQNLEVEKQRDVIDVCERFYNQFLIPEEEKPKFVFVRRFGRREG